MTRDDSKAGYGYALQLLGQFQSEDQALKEKFKHEPDQRFAGWFRALSPQFPQDEKPLAMAFAAAIVSHNG